MKIFYLFALLSLATLISGNFFQGDLKIVYPMELKENYRQNEQDYRTSIATFGENPWGRKVFGNLTLAKPLDACSFIQQDSEEEFLEHPILVAMRGNCTFSMKGHYAQLAGAKMLLIVDNKDESIEKILMIEDKVLGEAVNIPLIMMTKAGGNRIINSLQDPDQLINHIEISYNFVIPTSDQVEYEVWLTSGNPESFRFLREWKKYYEVLDKSAIFTPHYAQYLAMNAKMTSQENCLCGGTYCTIDPDGDEMPNTGRDVLLEDLRQMCIWKKFGPIFWWRYILNYDSFCMINGNIRQCSEDALKGSDIPVQDIDDCVENSFAGPSNYQSCHRNKYLEEESFEVQLKGVFLFPGVTVNDFTYRGNLIPPTGVFETVCESFTNMPESCTKYFNALTNGEENTFDDPMKILVSNDHHINVGVAAAAVLVIFACFVCLCYRRHLQTEMKRQMIRDVNVAVSQYISMKDDDD